jgi:hypothetical protein
MTKYYKEEWQHDYMYYKVIDHVWYSLDMSNNIWYLCGSEACNQRPICRFNLTEISEADMMLELL